MKSQETLNMDGISWKRKDKVMSLSLKKCTGLKDSLLGKSSMIRNPLHYLVERSLTVFWCISGKIHSSKRVRLKKGEKRGKNPAWRPFISACISEWWQLIIATALVMGDLCSRCVVPCYWSKPGKLIKSSLLSPHTFKASQNLAPG